MNTIHALRQLGLGAMAVVATLATATVLEVAIISSANAAEPQRAISLHGLDLKRPADVAVLYDRIRQASEAVCEVGPQTGSHLRSAAQQRCVSASIDSAVKTIDRAELSQYHRQAKAGGAGTDKAGA